MASSAEGPLGAYLAALHADLSEVSGGEVATYIPELAKADPRSLGIAIAAVDGAVYAVGDCDLAFTIQSVSKPFLYGLALETLGREQVMKHVGVEPTGDAFNSTVLDEENNRPFNPMVNAGAIAVTALVAGESYAHKRQIVLDVIGRYVGHAVTYDEKVFISERTTGKRNRAIASLMHRAEMLKGNTKEILDLYFSQCSVLVTTRDLAIMAATLANGGVNPITGVRAIAEEYVHDVLTVMHSCGMYNYAGQWSYEVGAPAKSGVSGSIAAVIPGQIGIAAFSPPLDRFGNSVRAIAACKRIAADFGLHIFRTPPNSGASVRSESDGAIVRSKRARTRRERQLLDEKGVRIGLIEAQGALFFGSAERLARRIEARLKACDHLIVDLRRVFEADQAACALLARQFERAKPGALLFAHAGGGRLEALRAELIAVGAEGALCANRDLALETCENALIGGEETTLAFGPSNLKAIDLFRNLDAGDLQALEALARPFVFAPGHVILRQGEAAQLTFVLAQGSASVVLKLPDGRGVRVATIGAGQTVGEMALLDGGTRSADVVADARVVAYGFSIAELAALGVERPQLLLTIMTNLARDLAERLRAANNEIRALEH